VLTYEKRFDVRLSSRTLLIRYMDHRGLSVRDLAALTHCSRSVIGHLRSGKRASCESKTAKAVERVLDVPAGTLFDARVSPVLRETAHQPGRAVA